MATPTYAPMYPELTTITLDKHEPSEYEPHENDDEENYYEQEGGSGCDDEERDNELSPGEVEGSDEEQSGGAAADGRDSPDIDYDGPMDDEVDEYDEDKIGHKAKTEEDGSSDSEDWDDDNNWELQGGARAVGFSAQSDDEGTPPPNMDDDGDDDGDAGSDVEDTVRLIDSDAARRELADMHPMLIVPTDTEVDALAMVVRDSNGHIIDENHSRTFPWMSRFERARILGTRATQLSHGASPQIRVPDGIIDSAAIASMELEQGQIPLIVRRPLPDGTSEYWPVHELEQIM